MKSGAMKRCFWPLWTLSLRRALTYSLGAWYRLADPSYWWMHAMVTIWAIFTLVLFVAEPLFLHGRFRQQATKDAEGTFRKAGRLHLVALTLSLITVAGAVLGAHGGL